MRDASASGSTHRRRSAIATSFALSLLLTRPSPAGNPAPDVWSLDLDQLLAVKVKVASKAAETVADAPSSVTVFTRSEIRNMGLHTLEDLLNFVPGFASHRTEFIGQEWALSTRGFWGVSDPAVLLLVDGLRVNEHFSGSFGFLDRLIDLGLAERVEVIRGPGSALYGSNAFYGVINIVTSKDQNEVGLEGGELSARDLSVSLAHAWGESHVGAYLREFADRGQQYEGVYDPYDLQDRTDDPREGWDAYISFRRERLRVNLRHQERDFRDFYLIGFLRDHVQRFHADGTGLFASYTFAMPERFTAELSGSASVYSSEGFGLFAPKGTGPYQEADLLLGALQETRVGNLGLDMTTAFGKEHTLAYGVAFEYADNPLAYEQSNYDIFTNEYLGAVKVQRGSDRRFLGNEPRSIESLYVQERYRPTDRITAIVGLRYDHYNDFGNTANPRGALIFHVGHGATLKLMYGQAFLAPSMEKLYLRNNPFEKANTDLEPQHIRTTEVACSQKAGPLEATLTLYQNRETDIFTLGADAEGTFRTVNGGDNTSRGAEVEMAANVGSHVFLRGTFSRVFDGERAEAFRTLASLAVGVNVGRFNVNVNGYARGRTEALPEQGPYAIVNGSVRCELPRGVALYLSGANLADRDYLTYGRNGDHELPNRGREVRGGVRYAF